MTLALTSRRAALTPGTWVRNELWRRARAEPSLDLRFAESKSLADAVTGQSLITFTRASSGTFVGSDGLIKTATTNLLLRSEEFDNAYWTKTRATVTADAAISPTGAQNADALIEDSTASNTHIAFSSSVSVATGTVYTYSVYAKANGRSWFNMQIGTGSEAYGALVPNAFFNVSNGTTGSVGNATASIQSVGNGWYRCVLVAIATTAATTTNMRIKLAESSSSDSYTGNGTSGIFLWGAQLERSSTVGEYIPTTSTINSAPRFDHNPTTGESLGLLVEEQRTNLLLYSACDANWSTGGFGAATYNLGLSALGIFSGVSVASQGQSWHSLYRTGISLTASTTYGFILYYRAGTSGRCRLVFRNNGATTETVINGAVGNLSVSAAFAGSATVLSQYLCADGLTYVVTGTYTPNGTSTDHWYRIGPDSTTSGQTVIALGGQLEAGAFPTSYIPTTTATVTRSADVASITGTAFSSWYRQDEGSFLVTGTVPGDAVGTFLSVDNNTADQRWQLRRSTSARGRLRFVSTGNTIDVLSSNNVFSIGSPMKMSGSAIAGAQTVFVNGSNLINATATAMPTVTQFSIGSGPSTDVSSQTISRLTYWPQRLSNSTLETLTQ